MLRGYPSRRDHLLARVQPQEFQLPHLRAADVQGIQDVFDKYHDQDLDLADACLVNLAEREGIHTIFTVDRRPFAVFRSKTGEAFRLLPEDC